MPSTESPLPQNVTILPKWFEIISLVFVVISLSALIIESNKEWSEEYSGMLNAVELSCGVYFIAEYLARSVYTQIRGRSVRNWMKYAFSGFGIIDLICALPIVLSTVINPSSNALKSLRLLRLFRIFKVGRYNSSMMVLSQAVRKVRFELLSTLFLAFLVVLMSSSIMWYLENEVQPEGFPDIISSFWWSVATLTTVGYGDVYPITAGGKLFAGIVAMVGIGLVAIPTGLISASFMDELKEQRRRKAEMQKNRD